MLLGVIFGAILLQATCLLSIFRRTRREKEVLRQRLAGAEARLLANQLGPHFLYNALASAEELIRAGRAQESALVINTLADLHRELLRMGQAPTTTLAREVDFVRMYLAIEQVRFGHRLMAVWHVDAACLSCEVPALTLHTLVENAVKHGIARRSSPGVVSITIARKEGELMMEVTNDPADAVPAAPVCPGTGLGLRNMRERLRHATRGRFHIVKHRTRTGAVAVRVSCPLPEPAGARTIFS